MRLGLFISTVLLAFLPLSTQSAYVMRKEEQQNIQQKMSHGIGEEEKVVKDEPAAENYDLEKAIQEEWNDIKVNKPPSKAIGHIGVSSGGNLLAVKAETVDTSKALTIAEQKAKEQEKADAEAAHTAMMKVHFTSMQQARQSHKDVSRILEELESADTVVDGFVQRRIPIDELIAHQNHIAAEERKSHGHGHSRRKDKNGNPVDDMGNPLPDDPASLAEQEKRTINTQTASAGGQFGFFAADRPHELRLDPENMKVYSWSTFKLLHPEKHLWNLEPMWKRLPKAPHKVHINRNRGIDGHSAASLLDQDMQPLIYIKDVNGFYHQGEGILTADDIEKAKHPVQYQALLDKEQDKIKNKDKYADKLRYAEYQNQTGTLQRLVDAFKDGDKFEQEDARDEMQMLRGRLAVQLKIHPTETKGRAIVNVRHAGRTKTYHIEIDQVTVKALKLALERDTGIPWETQILKHKLRTTLNNETMNEYCRAHTSRTFDLIQASGAVLEAAMRKRGTWKEEWDVRDGKKPAVTAPASPLQIKDEPQANAHGSASLLDKSGTKVKATSVAENFAEMRALRKKLTTAKKAKHRLSLKEILIERKKRSKFYQPEVLLKTEGDTKDEAKPALKAKAATSYEAKEAAKLSQDEEWASKVPTAEEAEWVRKTEFAKVQKQQRDAEKRKPKKKSVPTARKDKTQMKGTVSTNSTKPVQITDSLQTSANDDTEDSQETKHHHKKRKHHRGHYSGHKADATDKDLGSFVQQTLSGEEQLMATAQAKVLAGEKKLAELRKKSPTGSLSQKVVAEVLGQRSYATDLPNIVARHKAPKAFIKQQHAEAAERTTWVKEEDGTIHVARHEVAGKNHKLKHDKNAGRIDRGIPVDVLLEEEDPVDGEDFQKPHVADMPVLMES